MELAKTVHGGALLWGRYKIANVQKGHGQMFLASGGGGGGLFLALNWGCGPRNVWFDLRGYNLQQWQLTIAFHRLISIWLLLS